MDNYDGPVNTSVVDKGDLHQMPNGPWVKRMRALVPWCAGVAGSVAILVLVGWALDIRILKSAFQGLTTMKVNTAIELLLLSIALFGIRRHTSAWRWVLWVCVGTISVLGIMTQAEYLFGINLRIDNFLFVDRDAIKFPGRNAPATIWSCIACGIAFIMLNRGWRPGLAQALLVLTVVIPLATFGGYLYNAPGMYVNVPYPALALHTAIALTILCIGGLFAVPNQGPMGVVTSDSAAGRVARRLLPLAVGLPVLAGLLVLGGHHAGLYSLAFAAALLVSCCALLFTAAVWWTATLLWLTEQAGDAAEVQRSRAESALQASEDKFRLLANTIPQLAWMAGPDGHIFWYNERWYTYTGTRPEAMEGWGWQSVHDPAELPRVMAGWEESIRTGQPFDMEFPLRGADGNFRWFLTRIVPLRDASGKITLWFGTNTDIEDQRRVAQERAQLLDRERAAREQAEAASGAKDQFLAMLSHELRTPLMPALMSVSFLESWEDLPDDFREHLETIRRNIKLEARLVDDLLDMTRVSRGKIELHLETIDIHSLIRTAIGAALPDADGKQVRLSQNLGASHHYAWADPTRIGQVLSNLVQNAVKFTSAGGTVEVRTSDDDGRIRIEIVDTGVGIEPDVLKKLFNPFEQGERTLTRGRGGLGLGLAISKSFVEMHEGTINATSEGRGRGATFAVTLTALPEVIETKPEAPVSARDMDRGAVCSGFRILLVEDHDDTRKIISRLLKSFGCDVKTAASVNEALKVVQSEAIDFILSDIGLPDGSGLDVMRQASLKGIRGVALSGFGQDEDLRRSQEAGFEQHLIKPVKFDILRGIIQNASTGSKPRLLSAPIE